jgi:tetratricopeptide (TPR) repeat protein
MSRKRFAEKLRISSVLDQLGFRYQLLCCLRNRDSLSLAAATETEARTDAVPRLFERLKGLTQIAVFAFFFASSLAQAIDTSSGPATPAGAAVLLSEARQDYEHGLYEESIAPIERLLNRYPGYPDAKTYRELRAWLGHCLLVARKPEQAITPLETYIEGAGPSDQNQARGPGMLRVWGRIWLIEAYLQLEKYREALIAAQELLSDADHRATPEFEARSLLLAARALIALNRENDAQQRVDAASRAALLSGEPKVLGEQRLLQLELKLYRCSLWPSAKRLNEAETIDQLDRRGTCLEEAIIDFERLASAKSEEHLSLGQETLNLGYRRYLSACKNPPEAMPAQINPSPRQRATYLSELSAKVGPACRQHAASGAELLRQWVKSPEAKSAVASRSAETGVRTMIRELDVLKNVPETGSNLENDEEKAP